MQKKFRLFILLIIIFFSYAFGNEKQVNILSLEAQQTLEAKGFKVLGLVPKIVSPRKDTLAERQKLVKIKVSFELNKSGIKPIWLSKPQQNVSSYTSTDTIMTEDFEGSFPDTKWKRSGDPTWGKTNYENHSGNYSVWCAKDGTNGIEPGGSYPVNFESIMIYGPFDLSNVNYAELNFWHWLDIELEKDWFFYMASIDSNNFSGIGLSGQTGFGTGSWSDEALFLSNIPDLGDATGNKKVWIAFSFISDSHSSNDQGVYLDDVILTKKQVAGTPIVGGISGKLTPSGNPYIAVNDVGVAEGDSLIIEPGVEIRFYPGTAFFVNGTLKANGTVNDTTIFKSILEEPQYGDWGGLWISATKNDSCNISYCQILHGGRKIISSYNFGGNIVCLSDNIQISKSRMRDIYCMDASPLIKENNLINISCSYGSDPLIEDNYIQRISLGSYSDPIIKNNVIEFGGIHSSGGDPIIIGNTIRNCKYAITAYANTLIDQSANLTIIKNKIINCEEAAINMGQWAEYTIIMGNIIAGNKNGIIHERSDFERMIIVNNVIVNNSEDAILSNGGIESEHIILNNIIANNKQYGISAFSKTNISIMYNDLFDNATHYNLHEIDSLGIINQTNVNGDDCDKFYNIYLDPQFSQEDSLDFKLELNSPCINAGNPNVFFNDFDKSINDMGAFGGNGLFLLPTSFDFGRMVLNGTRNTSIYIFNSRESAFVINSSLLSDELNFSVSPNTTTEILPYEEATLMVAFSPKSVGDFSSILTINSNDFVGATSAEVLLTGEGISGTIISGGPTSGYWDITGSPYMVEGGIYIQRGSSLNIEPGVEVLFESGKLTIYGLLTSIGEPNNFITFSRSHPSKTWDGIVFQEADTLSRLEYCIFEHSIGSGLTCNEGSNITIKNCIIRNNGGGIELYSNSASKIVANVIKDNIGRGIDCWDSSPVIDRNIIQNNGASGMIVYAGSSPKKISNNLIIGNESLSSGGGVFFGGISASFAFSNNIVVGNKARYDGGGIYGYNNGQIVYLINNIISYNSAEEGGGMSFSSSGNTANFSILNSIIYFNTAEQNSQLGGWGLNSLNISYSDVQGGWEGEGNIDAEPLFVDASNGDYHLQPNSPCIDKGNLGPRYNDPEDPNKPGFALYPAMGTVRNDMGAYGGPGDYDWLITAVEPKSEQLEALPNSFEMFHNFPNPFNPTTTIKYQLPINTEVTLKIYNLLGQLIRTLVDENQMAGKYSVNWDGKDDRGQLVASGIYLYKLRANNFVQTKKMIIVR